MNFEFYPKEVNRNLKRSFNEKKKKQSLMKKYMAKIVVLKKGIRIMAIKII